MTDEPAIEITAFDPADQVAVRQLILDGLEEHWGGLDPDLNPDLDDIAASFGSGTVLVARRARSIVGVGVIVPVEDGEGEGEVKRMSVAREERRKGIGISLLRALVAVAERNGWHALRLETTATWTDAVGLYERYGFELTHYEDGRFGRDACYRLDLPPVPGT